MGTLCFGQLLTRPTPPTLRGGFPAGSAVKSPPAMQEMQLPSLHRESGGGHGNPLQYSCLENPLDRGDWRPQSMGSQESGKTERLNIAAPPLRSAGAAPELLSPQRGAGGGRVGPEGIRGAGFQPLTSLVPSDPEQESPPLLLRLFEEV